VVMNGTVRDAVLTQFLVIIQHDYSLPLCYAILKNGHIKSIFQRPWLPRYFQMKTFMISMS